MQGDRSAEIAGDDARYPDPKLGQKRRIETVMRLQGRDVSLGRARRDHHGNGIAGHDAQQNEHHDRHAGECQQRHGDAIGNDSKQHERSLS